MYENGRRLNRHSRKRKHIDKQKQRFLYNPFMGNATGMTYEQYLATRDEDDMNHIFCCRDIPYCEQYWRHAYVTGRRQFAKDATNGIIRAYARMKLNEFLDLDEEDWDDFDYEMEQHNGYQKYFDYAWTIW